MSLKAGRVGVNPKDVDPIDGHINPSSLEGYTKEEADAKFATKEALAVSQSASISLLDDTVGWVGKNLAPCHIDTIKALNTTGSWSGNVYTVTTSGNTAVFTFSTTSEGYVSEIDVNGAIATSSANIFLTDNLSLSNSLKLSGCPSGGDNQVYKLLATNTSGGSLTLPEDYGNGADLGVISSAFRIQLRLYSGAGTVSHIKFYPMLRDASITDSTFAPYHPPVSNLLIQLSTDMLTGSQLKAVVADSSDFADFKTKVAEM